MSFFETQTAAIADANELATTLGPGWKGFVTDAKRERPVARLLPSLDDEGAEKLAELVCKDFARARHEAGNWRSFVRFMTATPDLVIEIERDDADRLYTIYVKTLFTSVSFSDWNVKRLPKHALLGIQSRLDDYTAACSELKAIVPVDEQD